MKKLLVNNPTIGADIEWFLKNRETGEIVSAEGLIKGTKHEPFNFDPSNKFFATSLDNVLAEACVPPVSILDREKFIDQILYTMDYINKTIPKELCVVALPSATLADKWLQTENAQLFGCEPDMCVWTRSINEKPDAPNKNLRSAGGHIHIGYDDPNIETSELLVKAMDLFVGVPSVLQEPDNERKLLYGKAGCCRFKDEYGVEYRTISDYYTSDPKYIDWVFRATNRAIAAVNDGMDFDEYKEEILCAINDNNKVVAGNLIRSLQLEMA